MFYEICISGNKVGTVCNNRFYGMIMNERGKKERGDMHKWLEKEEVA